MSGEGEYGVAGSARRTARGANARSDKDSSRQASARRRRQYWSLAAAGPLSGSDRVLAVEDSYWDAGGRDLLRQAAFGDQVDAGVAAGSTDRPVGDQRAVGEPGPGSVTRPESGRPEWFQRSHPSVRQVGLILLFGFLCTHTGGPSEHYPHGPRSWLDVVDVI